jgi:pyridoxine kinase
VNILSIQSHVVYGHVGNAAAVFVLQRLGAEVWPLHTVQYSNHKGYGAWTGKDFSAAHVAELVKGLAARGALATCDAVLSGYVGQASMGAAIERTVRQVRRAEPDALYLCDPVMGDNDMLYVGEEIPAFFRERALPLADIVTPNRFELEILSGRRIASLDDALGAARAVLALGPKIVLLTSLHDPATPGDDIDMLAVTGAAAWRVRTPCLALDPMPNGTGDTVAAIFLAKYLERRDIAAALGHAAAAIFAILRATKTAGTRELELIAAQDELVKPARIFQVETIG